jgi:hypothetical protein
VSSSFLFDDGDHAMAGVDDDGVGLGEFRARSTGTSLPQPRTAAAQHLHSNSSSSVNYLPPPPIAAAAATVLATAVAAPLPAFSRKFKVVNPDYATYQQGQGGTQAQPVNGDAGAVPATSRGEAPGSSPGLSKGIALPGDGDDGAALPVAATAKRRKGSGAGKGEGAKKVPPSPRKYRDIELHGVWGRHMPGPLIPKATTETGAATVSMAVLR